MFQRDNQYTTETTFHPAKAILAADDATFTTRTTTDSVTPKLSKEQRKTFMGKRKKRNKNKTFKIGIMGAHGTGKSRLMLNLAQYFKNEFPDQEIGVLSGVSRKSPFRPSNSTTNLANQQYIFSEQIRQELLYSKTNDIVICDRTIFDNLAYSWYAGFDEWLHAALPLATEWGKTYDRFYFVRPDNKYAIADDGRRITDKQCQNQIDAFLAELIETYSLFWGKLEIGRESQLSGQIYRGCSEKQAG